MNQIGTEAAAAVEVIVKDLDQLKRRRWMALLIYAAIIAVLVTVLLMGPKKVMALERDLMWTLALGLFLSGSLLGACVTIGVPLFSRRGVYVASALVVVGLASGLFMIMDVDAPRGPVLTNGLPCFSYGTMLSVIAMAVLGVVSARLWRRFPDPGLIAAFSVTAVGMAALHASCGGKEPIHLFLFHMGPAVVAYGLARFLTGARKRLNEADL